MSHKMNSLNLYILHLIISICIFPICFCNNDLQWYDNCGRKFSCGNVVAGFPFWGGSSRPKECGYPELELTCEDELKPIIQIAKMKFYVLGIDQTTKVLKIARQDLTDGLCLQTFENTTLDFTLFHYAIGSQNITLLYGCPPLSGSGYADSGGGDGYINGQFACRISGVTDSTGYYQSGATGPNGCYASVVVPILTSSETLIGNGLSLGQAIDSGFEIIYNVRDLELCTKCRESNGRCGFDHSKSNATCVCPDGSNGRTPCVIKSLISSNSEDSELKNKRRKLFIVLAVFSSAAGICMLFILLFYVKKRCSSEASRLEQKVDVEAFLRSHGSSGPKRYTYNDLKKITDSFKNKIGEGGYGSVYKGQLENGSLVAVKLLHKSKGDTTDFINEVASIGNTNHVNVVKLMGFCYEGHKRALVYDFMANGSLEKFLSKGNNYHSLGLEILFKIAIGVARGLEYLHRGCNTRILHFDIKPHNILLDENFCPKVSDFGLAKSYPQKDSIIQSISEARGTVGYIAPEVFFKSFGGVSHKSDVYSYGMLVLEMVGCRRKANVEGGELSSEQYFPDWIYKQLEIGEDLSQKDVLSSDETEMQRKMIIVSLWCVKNNPSSRPAMTKVVEMLEGDVELEIPAASSLCASLRSQQHSLSAFPMPQVSLSASLTS